MSSYRPAGLPVAIFVLVAGTSLATGAVAQSKAALVRDVDRAAAQPVNGACSAYSSPGNSRAKCAMYTVPAGKRLVVETFSYLVYTDLNQKVVNLLVGKDSPQFANIIFAAGVYASAPGTPVVLSTGNEYVGSQQIRFYIEAGDALAAEVDYTGGINYLQSFTFSGYLVDK